MYENADADINRNESLKNSRSSIFFSNMEKHYLNLTEVRRASKKLFFLTDND